VTDEETEQSALERIVGVMCRCGLTLDDPRVKQAVDELLAEFLDMLADTDFALPGRPA
jgi:hypothetical protein